MPLLEIWKRLRSVVTRPERDTEAMRFSLGTDGKKRQTPIQIGQSSTARHGTTATPGELPQVPIQLLGGAWPGQKQPSPKKGSGEPVPRDIEKAVERLAQVFHYPQCKDIMFRKFILPTSPTSRACVIYYEGLADTRRVDSEILEPLMKLPRLNRVPKSKVKELASNLLLPAGSTESKNSIEEIVSGVMMGEAAILIEPDCVFLSDIKGPPTRQPTEPITERTTRGPQLGFVESHRMNTAMIRNFVHDPDLVLEDITVGRRTKTQVSLMYIVDIANPRLVEEVKRRLTSLDIDGFVDSGFLEALITDHPVSFIPTIGNTERPDRAAAQILQGCVVLVVGGSTRALWVPLTFSTNLHSAEDPFLRYPYTSFLRLIRLAGVVFALVLPGAYVAVSNYHQEMLPFQLLLTFVAAREAIPFPLVFSLLFLEFSFELIREAGIRIPSAIGPTIGIVGALLIGDMAVRATLVSSVTVIVVALTALANFSIPDLATAYVARILRFGFIALASVFGFFGMAIGFFVLAAHLAYLRSFGVPYLSPIAPWRAGSPDVTLRSPQWDQEKRPIFLRPLDLVRQARYVRAWDQGVPSKNKRGRKP